MHTYCEPLGLVGTYRPCVPLLQLTPSFEGPSGSDCRLHALIADCTLRPVNYVATCPAGRGVLCRVQSPGRIAVTRTALRWAPPQAAVLVSALCPGSMFEHNSGKLIRTRARRSRRWVTTLPVSRRIRLARRPFVQRMGASGKNCCKSPLYPTNSKHDLLMQLYHCYTPHTISTLLLYWTIGIALLPRMFLRLGSVGCCMRPKLFC